MQITVYIFVERISYLKKLPIAFQNYFGISQHCQILFYSPAHTVDLNVIIVTLKLIYFLNFLNSLSQSDNGIYVLFFPCQMALCPSTNDASCLVTTPHNEPSKLYISPMLPII